MTKLSCFNIHGVVVTLTNEGTNQTRPTPSNDQGQHAFVDVPPGIYTVAASDVS